MKELTGMNKDHQFNEGDRFFDASLLVTSRVAKVGRKDGKSFIRARLGAGYSIHDVDNCLPVTPEGLPQIPGSEAMLSDSEVRTMMDVAMVIAEQGLAEELDLLASSTKGQIAQFWLQLPESTRKAIHLLKQAQATKEAANV